jgi:hypothetical protein
MVKSSTEDAEKIRKKLHNEGKYIEAGWVTYKMLCDLDTTRSHEEISDMQDTFFWAICYAFYELIMKKPEKDEIALKLELLEAEIEKFLDERSRQQIINKLKKG